MKFERSTIESEKEMKYLCVQLKKLEREWEKTSEESMQT
jgi:hypothetical protein